MKQGSAGRSNQLVKQIGEHLVCAELGRRGLIATPFAGNVPGCDVLAVDMQLRAVAIQVKAAQWVPENQYCWPLTRDRFLVVEFDEATEKQEVKGPAVLRNPDLIYALVLLRKSSSERDRFFVLTESQLQQAVIRSYSEYLARHSGRRPKNPRSVECRPKLAHVVQHEDNWNLLLEALDGQPSKQGRDASS